MKTLLALLLGTIILLSSCVKQESSSQSSNSLSRISSKTYPLEIELSTTDSNFFEGDITVDLSSSGFLINNFGGVITYKVEELKFTINNYVGSESAQADFDISYVNALGTIGNKITYSNVPLNDFYQLQNFIQVNHSYTTLLMVEESMHNSKELNVHVEVLASEVPIDFTATFYITIKISSK
jgi:hypothetical protein